MISFTLCLAALIIFYFVYGKFVEKIFQPDNRKTPAFTKCDNVDFMPLPTWKIFMIQLLNIAGLGPIFGAIMGAKFGTASYLWIVLGTILAGATHDYFAGMISMRHDGESLPETIGRYLGLTAKQVMRGLSVILMVLVGAVFIAGPAGLLADLTPEHLHTQFWIVVIFAYYFLATMLPIDKIIGRIYPLFAIALIFMAIGILTMLFVNHPQLPEFWDGMSNTHPNADKLPIFPIMFVSIWAAAATYYFQENGLGENNASIVVNSITNEWLGTFGSILAILGVIAAPITSGDTALRSARLIIADAIHMEQKSIVKRLLISLPIFAVTFGILFYSLKDAEGFNIIWRYFAWINQTLSVFTLWAITVYLAQHKKPYIITLIPALFMTAVSSSYICIAPEGFRMASALSYSIGAVCTVGCLIAFTIWLKKKA